MVKRKVKLKLALLEILIIIFSLIIIIPLLIMFLGSVKNQVEAAQLTISLPSTWHFENFAFVIETGKIIGSFFNSVVITGSATVIGVCCAAMAAFVIARKKTKGGENLYNYFFLGMIAPMQIITTYLMLNVLHLSGSFLGIILIYVSINLPFNTFLFTSFISGIPKEIDEAANVDGCGIWRLFFTIIMPLLKPVIATSSVIFAMNVWNDFQLPLYFLSSPSKYTMPLTIYNFYGKYFSNWNYVFADMVLTAIPILIVYLIAQKYIVAGMTAGAVKG